jgi:CRISPR type III-A-associated RAMP protein Csm4
MDGENALTDILARFAAGSEPPFLISSLFPYYVIGGDRHLCLPARHLRLPRLLAEDAGGESAQVRRALKQVRWIPEEALGLLQVAAKEGKTPIAAPTSCDEDKCGVPVLLLSGSEWGLCEDALVHHELLHGPPQGGRSRRGAPTALVEVFDRPHNAIDRIGWHVAEGHLFYGEEFTTGLASGFYVLARGDLDTVETAFRFLEVRGLGGEVASGKGRFRLSEEVWVPGRLRLDEGPDASHALTLSHTLPTAVEVEAVEGDPLARYAIVRRRGIIEDAFLRVGRPWRDVVTMLTHGSVLPLLPDKEHVGMNHVRTSDGLSVHHYGYGLPYPLGEALLEATRYGGNEAA